jgi:hypothetical protein
MKIQIDIFESVKCSKKVFYLFITLVFRIGLNQANKCLLIRVSSLFDIPIYVDFVDFAIDLVIF